MNLNLKADVTAFKSWLDRLGASSPSAAVKSAAATAAPAVANAASSVAAAEAALEDALDAVAEGIANEAIAKVPGGELGLQFGGPILDASIAKLIDKGLSLIPGWKPASPQPAAVSAQPAPALSPAPAAAEPAA